MGRRFGGREGDCPVTESVSDRLLRLPFHNRLTPEEQQRVIVAVRDFAKAHVFAGFQAVPVALGIIALFIIVLLIIIFGVALGLFPGIG